MITLLLALLFPAQTAPAAPAAGWTYRENTDAATGKKSATAQIRDTASGGRLIVRCDTINIPIISVQFIPSPALPTSNEKPVHVYYDEARVETATWQFPGSGGYLADSIDVFRMVSGIVAAKSIRVDIDGGPEGVFKGPGNDTLFRQVYATCGFPFATPAVPVNPR